LNRKAEQLGLPGVSLVVTGEKTIKRRLDPASPFAHSIRCKTVEITGEQLKLDGGWTFVGTLEHSDGANILRALPDQEIPARFRTVEPQCDHCGLERNRVDTYIVANEAGDYLQVGKTCLKDFVGHRSPEAIAGYLEQLSILWLEPGEEDILHWGKVTFDGYGYLTWLTYVAASIRLWGWTPKSKASFEYPATAVTAESWLEDVAKPNNNLPNGQVPTKYGGPQTTRKGETIEITEPDKELAETAFQWALDLEQRAALGSLNDYLWNLWVCASEASETEIFKFRQLGLAASIISAYTRERAKEIERVDSTSEWVGQEGKRQEFAGLTVVDIKGWETDWGYQELYRLQDEAGNVLIWKTTSGSLEQGTTYYGKATVKKDGKGHTTFRGEKQTVITRPAFYRVCCDSPKPIKSNHKSVADKLTETNELFYSGWTWVCKNCLEGI
jgi:hypothetical protein